MTAPLERPATPGALFLWIMERFAEEFADHAVLKGGLALRLLDSPRSTTDIDYVFVPFRSKRDIRADIEAVLGELEDATVEITMHSKMLRAEIRLDEVAIQLEANVAESCQSIPMSTGGFAHTEGRAPAVVRIMSPSSALAHKLAAWNERRLMRDLYDCTFFIARLGVWPDGEVLDNRLASVNSRLPTLRPIRSMARSELAEALRDALDELDETRIRGELGGLLSKIELAGLELRMRAAIVKLAEWLE